MEKAKIEAAINASKIEELEEMLKETRIYLEQQMNLVSQQAEEIGQLQHKLETELRIRTVMGNNSIRKDEAIETARQRTAKTIEGARSFKRAISQGVS